MIERKHRYGKLVFDRNAIVRAALRAYVEAIVKHSPDRRLPLSFATCDYTDWMGDLTRGAFYNGDLERFAPRFGACNSRHSTANRGIR